jgi:uncharacterized protein (DUF1800 family)
MPARALSFVVVLALIASSSPAGLGAAGVPTDDAAITHALNRLGFGARPGDVAAIEKIGLGTWIEQQLQDDRKPEPALEARLARLTTINLDPATIARDYIAPAREERRRRQLANQSDGDTISPQSAQTRSGQPQMEPPQMRMAASATTRRARQVFTELSEAKLVRAVYSERQLEEVLTDFWFNHFNVFGRKAQTELYVGEYEREVIRPHVFGRFRDLLGATATSPAMLVYLDNWMSKRDGINENYARELMELHTLGVDGGYTQQDVGEVARALTGWTLTRPRGGGEFRFARMLHDNGEKKILGQVIRAGGGMDDGERVLDILAAHPSTARHIAFKLAQRLVSDIPPPALVDRAAARFRDTNGDLREVVRVIVTAPEFFAASARNAKVKTPFEFVVSALRATGAEVSSGFALARALSDMGMPLYLCQPPTGYGETADAWLSSGSLVNRINFAVELSQNRLRGVRIAAARSADAIDIGAPDFQRQ